LNRTVKTVGGVVTAVAVVVVLGIAYLSSGGSPTAAPTCAVPSAGSDGLTWVCLDDLPEEAQQTVSLIDAGGPFPYEKDGSTFNNFEGVLPQQPRGYFREYTVPTPGKSDRGARRIVTGDQDRELFYTADHYETFVRVQR
jgi:ribonuclease T1